MIITRHVERLLNDENNTNLNHLINTDGVLSIQRNIMTRLMGNRSELTPTQKEIATVQSYIKSTFDITLSRFHVATFLRIQPVLLINLRDHGTDTEFRKGLEAAFIKLFLGIETDEISEDVKTRERIKELLHAMTGVLTSQYSKRDLTFDMKELKAEAEKIYGSNAYQGMQYLETPGIEYRLTHQVKSVTLSVVSNGELKNGYRLFTFTREVRENDQVTQTTSHLQLHVADTEEFKAWLNGFFSFYQMPPNEFQTTQVF